MTLIAHTDIKASRKQRQCDWCEEAIDKGKSYIRQRYGGSDGPGVVRWHPQCYLAFSRLPYEYQEDSLFYTPYTRGCNCYKDESESCNTPEFHVQEMKVNK